MQIKFPGHDHDLEDIESFLERHSLPKTCDLKKFLGKLSKIDRSLNQEEASNPHFDKQKELVQKLAGRCHQLEVRRDVIDIAENAESLVHASNERPHEEILLEAKLLRAKIDILIKAHRPSQTNAKFLRFARICLDKAEKHEPLVVKKAKNVVSLEHFAKKETTLESFEFAEDLYALAGSLYENNVEKFVELFSKFPKTQQDEIHFHVSLCHSGLSDLESKERRLFAIQGILGYAHLITDYYFDNTPYPTIVEIHNIFQDLDFVNFVEQEDK